MRYKDMIKEARRSGVSSEQAMLSAVDNLDELLEEIRDEKPDLYWQFIRDTHESLHGAHYNEEFANYDLSRLRYTDAQGKQQSGAWWTKAEAVEAMGGHAYKQGVTDCDKWVAANVMHADLCRKFNDEQVLTAAYLFFFADEDWGSDCKIWEYMNLARG